MPVSTYLYFSSHPTIAVTSHKYTHTSNVYSPDHRHYAVPFVSQCLPRAHNIIIIILCTLYPLSNGDILSSNTNRRFYCFDGSDRRRYLCTPSRFRSFAKLINAISRSILLHVLLCIISRCRKKYYYQLYVALIYNVIEIPPSKQSNSNMLFGCSRHLYFLYLCKYSVGKWIVIFLFDTRTKPYTDPRTIVQVLSQDIKLQHCRKFQTGNEIVF